LKNRYSLIPVNSEKKPYVHWKKYQYHRASTGDIFNWLNNFTKFNIGIVTGEISQLAVIDVDDLSLLPELNDILPELKETTRFRTRRGYHYYFFLNNKYVKSTNNLFNKKLELKSNGTYVVAPPSTINNHKYIYEIPLSEILPIPEIITKNNSHTLSAIKKDPFKMPKYHGLKVDCMCQILKRNIQEGERNNSLFILYNLLLQNKNTKKIFQEYNFAEK